MSQNKPARQKTITSAPINEQTARRIDSALEAWFSEFQRDLNFRNTHDPYAIMVAEFMLQQTTAVTVQGYFPAFMAQFPTVRDLAAATEDEVMRMWAGLGYYRRARQLQAAAQDIVRIHGGIVPRDVAALQKLPGIGRYTAGAIVSAAFDLPAPILEANTVRVFARLAGNDGVTGDTAFMQRLWQVAESLVMCAKSPRVFNIAAMELGALICRPQPRCEECPVRKWCGAYNAGLASEIPRQRPRRETVDVTIHGFVLSNDNGEFLVRRIQPGEWHAGMWEFPTAKAADLEAAPDESFRSLGERLPLDLPEALQFSYLCDYKYQVTHHRVRLRVWTASLPPHVALDHTLRDVQFLSLEAISGLPMGSAQKKLLTALLETESRCRP